MMVKSKPQTSAAQRREQARQQRQQRLNTGKSATKPVKSRKRKSSGNNPWPLLGGILLMVVVVVGIFFYMANQQQASTTQGATQAFQTLTHIDTKSLDQIGAGGAQDLLKALPSNAQVPNGPTGKPQFLIVGAEYCPYCAAQRWSVISALSRFGTWSPLSALSSSENNIPTYSFRNVHYTSQYIDLVALETEDNQRNPLDTLTPEQSQLLNTYDGPPYTNSKGGIPFILIGNKYTASGAFYDPTILASLSYQDIEKQLKDPNSEVARDILGGANDLTAAICRSTQDQPASVCTTGSIPQIEQSLPSPTTITTGNAQIALDSSQLVMDIRRQE